MQPHFKLIFNPNNDIGKTKIVNIFASYFAIGIPVADNQEKER
jgi:hypothetical protein